MVRWLTQSILRQLNYGFAMNWLRLDLMKHEDRQAASTRKSFEWIEGVAIGLGTVGGKGVPRTRPQTYDRSPRLGGQR